MNSRVEVDNKDKPLPTFSCVRSLTEHFCNSDIHGE
jgi:hypothetical protein